MSSEDSHLIASPREYYWYWGHALISWQVAALLVFDMATAPAAETLTFEGVPPDFNYDGSGLNLGGHYASRPGAPVFGPQATVLEVGGGTLNDSLYPPLSGSGVLWGEGKPIEVEFSTGLASSVCVYYRANTVLYLYAYDSEGNLIRQATGPPNLAPAAPQYLNVSNTWLRIKKVRIQDSGNFFVIDDFSYNVGTNTPTPVDIGLRLFDGTNTVRIAGEAPGPGGVLTSPLRIHKNGTNYSIVLVETTAPDASKIQVKTSSGVKAWRKLP